MSGDMGASKDTKVTTKDTAPEEFERFEELARKLVNTPKDRIDAKRREADAKR